MTATCRNHYDFVIIQTKYCDNGPNQYIWIYDRRRCTDTRISQKGKGLVEIRSPTGRAHVYGTAVNLCESSRGDRYLGRTFAKYDRSRCRARHSPEHVFRQKVGSSGFGNRVFFALKHSSAQLRNPICRWLDLWGLGLMPFGVSRVR